MPECAVTVQMVPPGPAATSSRMPKLGAGAWSCAADRTPFCTVAVAIFAFSGPSTDLVIQAAGAAAGFPGGRLWVPLGLVARDELVTSSVALALGIRPGAGDVTAQLAAALAPLGRALLVLDGCEAVVDGVASLVTTLVSYCPLLSLVVTSRVPLAVEGERVIAPGPLPGPAGQGRAAILASLPLRLLADRVHAGGGGSTSTRRSPRSWPNCAGGAAGCRWRLSWSPRSSP